MTRTWSTSKWFWLAVLGAAGAVAAAGCGGKKSDGAARAAGAPVASAGAGAGVDGGGAVAAGGGDAGGGGGAVAGGDGGGGGGAGAAAGTDDDDNLRMVTGAVEKKDTLSSVLTREGIDRQEQAAIVKAMTGVFDFRSVREGQTYALGYNPEGELERFEYVASLLVTYEVERGADGAFTARRNEKPVDTQIVEIGGPIDGTLYETIKKTGESTALVGTIVDVFAWDINFYTDQHPGDSYKVVIEKQSLDGKHINYGKLLAAEYSGKVGTYRAFYFQAEGAKKGSYYDDKGQNIVKSMLKTPLRFVRISSGFNPKRMHPILHITRGHMGTDFAAPVGTPVWSTADGTVSVKLPESQSRGKGNYLEIKHAGGLTSGYMHLSKFAKGLKLGQVVKQKQVIGYVGTTGLSTGPHLHFMLKENGSYVDPQKVKMRRDVPVPKGAQDAFKRAVADRMAAFQRIDSKAKAATAAAAAAPVQPAPGAPAPPTP